MGKAAADGAAVADLIMRDVPDGRHQERMRLAQARILEDVAPARHGAERDSVLRDLDLPQLRKLAQIDKQRRRRDPERQHRHQALAAGQRLGLAVMRGEKSDGFGNAGRAGVFEGRKFHDTEAYGSLEPVASAPNRRDGRETLTSASAEGQMPDQAHVFRAQFLISFRANDEARMRPLHQRRKPMLKKTPRNGKQNTETKTAKAAAARQRTAEDQQSDRYPRHPRPRRQGSAAATTISSSTSMPMSPRRRSGRKSSTAWTATSTSRWRVRSRNAAARRRACSTPRPDMLYQDVFGRIPHQQRLGEAVPGGRTHAQVTLVQRAMDSHGHRLHGGVPDADAGARHAPADRDGSRDRQRLQQMADRGNSAAGSAHQGDAVSAVQSIRKPA